MANSPSKALAGQDKVCNVPLMGN